MVFSLFRLKHLVFLSSPLRFFYSPCSFPLQGHQGLLHWPPPLRLFTCHLLHSFSVQVLFHSTPCSARTIVSIGSNQREGRSDIKSSINCYLTVRCTESMAWKQDMTVQIAKQEGCTGHLRDIPATFLVTATPNSNSVIVKSWYYL